MDHKLTSRLKKDSLRNIAILGFFSSYRLEAYFTEGNSMLLLGKSDQLWAHISSASEKELTTLLDEHHKKARYYFSVENWMIPVILKYGTEDWIMKTNRFVLNEKVNLEIPRAEVVAIDASHAAYLFEQSDYQDYISTAYIIDRLSKDISAGLFVNNKLVAWGFTHDDGALGFLHVLDDYRNRGYGFDILSGLIQMRRKQQKPVFGNIVPDNEASIRLVTKLGFTFDRQTNWIKLK